MIERARRLATARGQQLILSDIERYFEDPPVTNFEPCED